MFTPKKNQRFHDVMAAVEKRVAAVTVRHNTQLPHALQLAFAARMREAVDLVGLLADRYTHRSVTNRLSEIALTNDEWQTLVASHSLEPWAINTPALIALRSEPQVVAHLERLAHTLLCTLAEKEKQDIFDSAYGGVVCFVAMHDCDVHSCIATALGTVASSDRRRLDDLSSTIDDEAPCSLIELGDAIVCLSNAVR